MSFPELDRSRLPAAVREVAARLESQGHGAWWVGESLARALRGEPAARQPAWELATGASSEEALALFPSAVPTSPERGVVTAM